MLYIKLNWKIQESLCCTFEMVLVHMCWNKGHFRREDRGPQHVRQGQQQQQCNHRGRRLMILPLPVNVCVSETIIDTETEEQHDDGMESATAVTTF